MHVKVHDEMKAHMDQSVEYFKEELASIRAGRANPRILDKVMVSYYGVDTPINQTANISVPEPRLIQVKPFDMNLIGEVEKAINGANLGFNATNDGKIIRIAMPMLTEERRHELVKQAKTMAEEAKVAVRNLRRSANDSLKKMKDENELTEDDLARAEKSVQSTTDEFTKKIDEILSTKEAEILEI